VALNMDNCEHGFPQFLCRRCDGKDRRDSVVPSGLVGQVNPGSDESINVADHGMFDTIAAAEEVHDPLEGLVEKTAGDPGEAMAMPPPRRAHLENAAQMAAVLPPIAKIAELLGGDVQGDEVLCPGPGHSAGDRSLSVKLDPADREGFVTYSFAGDDWKACRDHVRKMLGLPEPRSEFQQKTGTGKWSMLGEYIYYDENGERFLKVRKCRDENGKKQFPQYHWDGNAWAKGKPQGSKVPYRLPQLIATPTTAQVYFCEGEKDADNLAKIGFVATTASEGAAAKWDPGLTQFFKDRNVVILPDADRPGRAHAQKVAKAIHGVAASVRIVDLFPDRQDGSDVSDWIVKDTAGVWLAKLVGKADEWEPSGPATRADDAKPDEEESEISIEISRLAKLTVIKYEQERKVAAEARGVRASVLDQLVRDERARLGEDDSGMQGRAISFPEPEPWPEPVDGAALLDEISRAIGAHVVMPEASRDACALWVAHTFLLDGTMISPRLAITSPTRGCGKTTALDVISQLVLRPLPAANVSASAIFRVVEGFRPTLLIDEADTFLKDNDELRGILNSGHRKGGAVLRNVGDDHEPRSFSTYGACAIALIGQLPGTLTDRSVPITLTRRKRDEDITPFRLDRVAHLVVLARKLARWTADNDVAIAATEPEMPAGIYNRAADNWRPLLWGGVKRLRWRVSPPTSTLPRCLSCCWGTSGRSSPAARSSGCHRPHWPRRSPRWMDGRGPSLAETRSRSHRTSSPGC
jgi:5S rRNA maturation endonuclease (ribonuclease M5)